MFFVSVVVEPPEMDLCFAVSATAALSQKTFNLMKKSIIDVVDTYGAGKVRYSVVLFGSVARLVVKFSDGALDPTRLKGAIGSLVPSSGAPALDEALERSFESFKDGEDRPNARKVLIVMLDNESGLQLSDIMLKARALETKNIRVITVGIGDSTNKEELETMASDNRDILLVPTSEPPSMLSKDIMVLVLTGKWHRRLW